MASVYKPLSGSGRPVKTWTAAFYIPGPDGKRVLRRKSTGLTDRKKAMQIALSWERAGELASEGRLTQQRSREVLAEIMEITGAGKLEEFSAEGWLRAWLNLKQANASAGTLIRYRSVIESFILFLGAKAGQPLEHLSTADLTDFQQRQLQGGRTANTVNLSLKIVAQALRAAQKRGVLRHNPAAPLETVRDDGGEGGRAPFTLPELEALLRAAEGTEWHGVILTGLYTAARLSDVTGLRWSNVDLSEGTLTFRPRKTIRTAKKDLRLPLAEPLKDYLSALPPPADAASPLFPTLSRKAVSGHRGLSVGFKELMQRAGIDAGIARKRGGAAGHTVSARSFHSLRHTLNSWMHNGGVSQEVRQRILGHASPEMNNKYTHTDTVTLRDALAAVPKVGLK